MRKTPAYLYSFFFFLFSQSFIAQTDSDSITLNKNTIFAEIFGSSGSQMSIQYDRIIKTFHNSYLNLNIGFGYLPSLQSDLNPIYGIPLALNWTSGLKQHHFETGLGLTYGNGTVQIRDSLSPKNKLESYVGIYATLRIGYKYQNPNGPLFFRVGLTPMLKIYRLSRREFYSSPFALGNFLPSVGIGLGYSF